MKRVITLLMCLVALSASARPFPLRKAPKNFQKRYVMIGALRHGDWAAKNLQYGYSHVNGFPYTASSQDTATYVSPHAEFDAQLASATGKSPLPMVLLGIGGVFAVCAISICGASLLENRKSHCSIAGAVLLANGGGVMLR